MYKQSHSNNSRDLDIDGGGDRDCDNELNLNRVNIGVGGNAGLYHRIVSALSFPEMFKVVGLLIYPYVNAYILHQVEEHSNSNPNPNPGTNLNPNPNTGLDQFKYSAYGYPSNIMLLLLFSNCLGISVWLIYARAIQTALKLNMYSIHVYLLYLLLLFSVIIRIIVRYICSGLSVYEIWLLGVL